MNANHSCLRNILQVNLSISLVPCLQDLYFSAGLFDRGKTLQGVKRIYDQRPSTGETEAVMLQTRVLPLFPPIFHRWFLSTFSDPSSWFQVGAAEKWKDRALRQKGIGTTELAGTTTMYSQQRYWLVDCEWYSASQQAALPLSRWMETTSLSLGPPCCRQGRPLPALLLCGPWWATWWG